MRRTLSSIVFGAILTAATIAAPPPTTAAVSVSPMPPVEDQTPVGSTGVIGSISISSDPLPPMETITVSQITFGGPDGADFSIATEDCIGVPLSVWDANGGHCWVSVAFSPSRPDLETASIDIAYLGSISGPGTRSQPLEAVGGPVAALCGWASFPKTVAFPTVDVGGTSRLGEFERLRIANCGEADLHVSGVIVGGPDADAFQVGSASCLGTYLVTDEPWWQSCFVDMTFTPPTPGAMEATVTVVSNGIRSPQVLTVTGQARAVADLGVTLVAEANPAPALRGGVIAYTMTIENLGPSVAEGAYVGWSFSYPGTIESAPADATCAPLSWGDGMTCIVELGDLDAGESVTLVTQVRIGDSGVPGSLFAMASIGSSVADRGYGNNLATSSIPIQDTEAPSIEFFGNASPYPLDGWVSLWCVASDNVAVDWSRTTCSTTSGPAYEFAPGPVEVTATAFDLAGHRTDVSTTITIGVSYAGVATLSRLWVTDPEIADALCAMLAAASSSELRGQLKAEAGQLRAYRALLAAQSGKAIAAEDATLLIQISNGL
jgi:hypothetical protein